MLARSEELQSNLTLCMQSYRGQGDELSTASTAEAGSESPGTKRITTLLYCYKPFCIFKIRIYAVGMAERSDRFASTRMKGKISSTPQHGGWSLWRSIKQSFADEPTESSRASIKSKVRLWPPS